MKNEIKSYGFVPSRIESDQYILGGGMLPKIILQSSRNWKEFLPKWESQINNYETSGCTCFGTLNAIETIFSKLNGGNFDFAERYNYILANITHPGADPHYVSEIIRKYGVIEQAELPMPSTYEEFNSPKPMTVDKLVKGQEWLKQYSFGHEWVFTNTPSKQSRTALMREALQYSPVCVSVSAWYKDENGLFIDADQLNGHWCLCYGIDDDGGLLIFDSYALIQNGVVTDAFKKLHPDHRVMMAKRYYIEAKKKEEKLSWIGKILAWLFKDVEKLQKEVEALPKQSPISPVEPPKPTEVPKDIPKYDFSTKVAARHSVRVICDERGLSLEKKNLICAVIKGESDFDNNAVNKNKNKKGEVTSIDWGICQINDYYHIGVGKTFANVGEVLKTPEKPVNFMIDMEKAGHLDLWIAYKNGSYKKYL